MFEPTRTELRKLTKELKKKIWGINDELLHLKCLNRNSCFKLIHLKSENLALLDLSANEWRKSAYSLRIRSQIKSINSMSKHQNKLKQELNKLLSDTMWNFDENNTKTKHTHKLILEKKKLKSLISIINGLLSQYHQTQLLHFIDSNNSIYNQKLSESYQKQMLIKSKMNQLYQIIYNQINKIYSQIYHFEKLYDCSIKLAINKQSNEERKENVFIELTGFDKFSELQLIIIRTQKFLRSLWSNLAKFKMYTTKLHEYLPFDIDSNDNNKLNQIISNNLFDPQMLNSFKSSKYFKIMIQKCYDYITKETLSHSINDYIYDQCNNIILHLFQNQFEYNQTQTKIQDILRLFINYMEKIKLFENKNWQNILFQVRQIALFELFKYFDDLTDFQNININIIKVRLIHSSRLILLDIYNLCGIRDIYTEKIIITKKMITKLNENMYNKYDWNKNKLDESIKRNLKKKGLIKNKLVWNMINVDLNAINKEETMNNNKNIDFSHYVYESWIGAHKLTDCQKEFFDTFKFRDSLSCKNIIKPFQGRNLTQIQLIAQVINIYDKSISLLRKYYKEKDQQIALKKIENFGKKWKDQIPKIDRESFDAAGLLILELIANRFGIDSKWNSTLQKAWIYELDCINNALYQGSL